MSHCVNTCASQAAARIVALQTALAQQQLDACTVFSADPHLSEYLPEHWQARAWLSGFNGSAGTLVVTRQQAALWTDSRYWEQAEHDLADSGIRLMRSGEPGVPQPADWLTATLPRPARLAVDAMTLSASAWEDTQETFTQAGITLVTDMDFLSQVWTDRPPLPHAPVFEHPMPFACRTRAQKLASVRQAMKDANADWHWVSALDDIAWLLNLRGADVSYNPVFLAHLLLDQQGAQLFVEPSKISAALTARLAEDGIVVRPYEAARAALHALPAHEVVWLDPDRVVAGMVQGLNAKTLHAGNPSQIFKACKLDGELDYIRATMAQDGAALCEFFAWFEAQMARQQGHPQSAITELTIDEQITAARARREHFVSPSFATIAAFNANGAMPHYQATPNAHAAITGNGLLLIDSGGQYLGGTTDITRVVPVGSITQAQKEDFTRVLKGMIALSRAVFPEGASGTVLDALARQPLWQHGLDYGHGTGHGVGYFINVHEGPQSIAWRAHIRPESKLHAGMVTSNEPGLYRPGQWGIRIENLMACVPAQHTEFGRFLRFETLTLCPIDTRCVAVWLLNETELEWLNDYHATVRERLLPLVSGAARQWLQTRTRALKKPASKPSSNGLMRWLRRRSRCA